MTRRPWDRPYEDPQPSRVVAVLGVLAAVLFWIAVARLLILLLGVA